MNDFTSLDEAYAFRVLSLLTEADEKSPLLGFDTIRHALTQKAVGELWENNDNTCMDMMARFNRTFAPDLPAFDMKLDPWFDSPVG